MHFFTADQHYGHANIIRFCDRPFSSIEEMDRELIRRHNEVVGPDDTVIHAGDFAYRGTRTPQSYLQELNGHHILVRGSHDRWQLHGHSHGTLEPLGKQWDVGVDHNDFTPVSFAQLKEIMAGRPDNPGLVTGSPDGRGRLSGGR